MSDTALIERFLRYKSATQGRTDGTVVTYRHRLNLLVEFLGSRDKDLVSAESQDLIDFTGEHLHRTGVAPRSRRPAIAATRQFYAWLHKKGLARENKAMPVEYPRVGRTLPHVMPAHHAEALLMAPDLTTLRGCRDAAIFGVLIGTGVRVSGLVRLNQEDLVFDRDPESNQMLAYLRVTEKGGHDRLAPVPAECNLLLRIYLAHADLAKIDRTLPNGDRALFVSLMRRDIPAHEYFGESRRLRTGAVRHLLRTYGAQAKVPPEYLHPHAFRHLFGTELAEQGIDVHVRGALLGHRSIESTLLYDRLAIRRLNDASRKGNPFRRMRTPVTDLVKEFRAQGLV